MHKINLLKTGKIAFPQIIKRIQTAKKSILINMFVWRDDEIGNSILKELIHAANRGVKITISKDQYAQFFEIAEENKQSLFHKKKSLLALFKAIILNLFYPSKKRTKGYKQNTNHLLEELLKHENSMIYKSQKKKDHSKFFVFDKEIVILGGMNIEQKEVTCDLLGKNYYDLMVEIVDENLVYKFFDRFYGNLAFNKKDEIGFVVNNKKLDKLEIKEFMYQFIENTNKELIIMMAFLNERKVIKNLIKMINHGIKVKILMAQKMHLQSDMNLANLKKIMKKTNNQLELYLSEKIIHAKALLSDQRAMTIGSSNLTKRDFNQLDQVNILLNKEDSLVEDFIQSFLNEANYAKKISSYREIRYNKFKAVFEKIIM